MVSMREMLEAGCHFGHQTRFWNPKMGQYIFAPATRFTSSTSKRRLPSSKKPASSPASSPLRRQDPLRDAKRGGREIIAAEPALRQLLG